MLSIVLAVSAGAVAIAPGMVWGIAFDRIVPGAIIPDRSAGRAYIVWEVRLPRVILAGLVGAGLVPVGGCGPAIGDAQSTGRSTPAGHLVWRGLRCDCRPVAHRLVPRTSHGPVDVLWRRTARHNACPWRCQRCRCQHCRPPRTSGRGGQLCHHGLRQYTDLSGPTRLPASPWRLKIYRLASSPDWSEACSSSG